MGVNDAQEMLEVAQEECIRLERENAELLRRAERAETLNQITQQEFRQTGTVKAERDAAVAELAELTELASGSDHVAAKYWKQRQDARNELARVKNDRDDARAERDALLAAIDQVKAEAGKHPLLSPCHGAVLHVSTAYEGRPYMQEAVPESLECTAVRCYNSWDAKTGEPE